MRYRPESRRAVVEALYLLALCLEAFIDLVKLWYSLRRLLENVVTLMQKIEASYDQSP